MRLISSLSYLSFVSAVFGAVGCGDTSIMSSDSDVDTAASGLCAPANSVVLNWPAGEVHEVGSDGSVVAVALAKNIAGGPTRPDTLSTLDDGTISTPLDALAYYATGMEAIRDVRFASSASSSWMVWVHGSEVRVMELGSNDRREISTIYSSRHPPLYMRIDTTTGGARGLVGIADVSGLHLFQLRSGAPADELFVDEPGEGLEFQNPEVQLATLDDADYILYSHFLEPTASSNRETRLVRIDDSDNVDSVAQRSQPVEAAVRYSGVLGHDSGSLMLLGRVGTQHDVMSTTGIFIEGLDGSRTSLGAASDAVVMRNEGEDLVIVVRDSEGGALDLYAGDGTTLPMYRGRVLDPLANGCTSVNWSSLRLVAGDRPSLMGIAAREQHDDAIVNLTIK